MNANKHSKKVVHLPNIHSKESYGNTFFSSTFSDAP